MPSSMPVHLLSSCYGDGPSHVAVAQSDALESSCQGDQED